MRVLVACEFSGIVREAFKARGRDAWSCDLLPTEIPGNHIQGDVLDVLGDGWDLMIAHPPCQYLTCTANRSFLNNPERWGKRLDAILFVYKLMNAQIEKICIENPRGVISSHIRKPEQIIQPFFWGDEYQKETHLWLKNLKKLKHYSETDMFVEKTHTGKGDFITFPSGKRMPKWYAESPSTNNIENAKLRSKTFHGIAVAMAQQWG